MRRIALAGSTLVGMLVALSTEILSLFGALNRWTLLGFWSVSVLVALGVGIRMGALESVSALVRRRARAFWNYATASPWRLVVLLALLLFVAAIGLVALSAAPNNYDSLTYHMGRVAHWTQNESVAIYPSVINRQYEYPPFAEYVITQLQLMTGGDALANLVQFGAYLGCILLVSMIARVLGLSADGQLLAGVVAAAIPMAVMQAASTQNDLVAAFWLSAACYWVLVSDRLSLRTSALVVGASLALASFVKFPAALYSIPILLWYLLTIVRRPDRRQALSIVLPILAVLLLVVQGTHYTRRAVLAVQAFTQPPVYGAGISAREELSFRYINRRVDAAAISSNVVRSVAAHLSLPVPAWNAALTQLVVWFHQQTGTPLNHVSTTYGRWEGVQFVLHEDYTGNLLHLVLGLAAIGWIVMGREAARQRWREYAAVVVGCIVIFLLVLKWQPWNSRLETPWFVLTAPLIAVFLRGTLGTRGSFVASLVLLVCALPWLFWAVPRPLLGAHSVLTTPRESQYFATNPQLEASYRAAVGFIRSRACNQVGLVWGGNDIEYPLFPLLNPSSAPPVRIEHVNVTNASQFTERTRPPFQPCVILAYKSDASEITYQNTRYLKSKTWQPLSAFVQTTP